MRPWWRQRWATVVAGYALAILVGIAFAHVILSYGDWHDGLAWERAMIRGLQSDLPPWADSAMMVLPWLGTNWTLLPLSLITIAWLVRQQHVHDAVYLGVVQLGSNTLNPVLKFLYDRQRPEIVPRRGWYDWAAYPSGHAIASVAVLVTLCIVLYRARGWRWPCYLVAPLFVVSLYSRVYLGVHWPTDVIGGVLMGATWLAFTYIAFRPHVPRSRES